MFPTEKRIIPLNSKVNDAPLHQAGGSGGAGGGGATGGGGAGTGGGAGPGAGGGKQPVVAKNENITIVAIRIFFIFIISLWNRNSKGFFYPSKIP